MTHEQRAERRQRILAHLRAGEWPAEIAAREGLTEQYVRMIAAPIFRARRRERTAAGKMVRKEERPGCCNSD